MFYLRLKTQYIRTLLLMAETVMSKHMVKQYPGLQAQFNFQIPTCRRFRLEKDFSLL